MLDSEAFVFIRAHKWDGKTREMKQQPGLRTKVLRFCKN